jgi:hypothetical protein
MELQSLPNTTEEWDNLLASNTPGIVRSLDDWHRSLTAEDHPLRALDRAVLAEFTDTLQFKNGGLAHAKYEMIVDHLTYRQFVQLWALFGLSMKLFNDYNNMQCVGAGTCHVNLYSVCTSHC